MKMRRQGHYGDPSANTCVGGGQMHHMAGQRGEAKSGNFEGRLEAFTPERENPYANSKQEGQGQWRWEIDEAKMSNSMASRMFNEGKYYSLPLHACLSFYLPSHALHLDLQKQYGHKCCEVVARYCFYKFS